MRSFAKIGTEPDLWQMRSESRVHVGESVNQFNWIFHFAMMAEMFCSRTASKSN